MFIELLMEQTCHIPLSVVNALITMSERIQKDIKAIATEDELNNSTTRHYSLWYANMAIMCALHNAKESTTSQVSPMTQTLLFRE